MSSQESRRGLQNKDAKLPKAQSVDGVKGWLIVMVSLFWAFLILENYKRFGIQKGPFEIIFQLSFAAIQRWWLLGQTIIYFLQQTTQMFLLEKLLIHGVITEKVGMILHALNVFFLPSASVYAIRIYGTDLVFTRMLMAYILFFMTKTWSYAYVNRTYRQAWKKKIALNTEKVEGKEPTIPYPHNVTVRNIIEYMLFTPPIQYQSRYPQRTSPDWKTFAKRVLQLFSAYWCMNFLCSQFILPELLLLKREEGGGLFDKFECALRIVLPFNLLWLLHHMQNFRCFLPGYAALVGMKSTTFTFDWWNSADMSEFWRKWNVPVRECLRYNVILPLVQHGYSLTTATFIAFAVAGVIHEYLNLLPFGIFNGLGFLMTLGEMPAGYLTVYVARRFGRGCGNIMIWIYLVVTHTIALIYLTLHYDIF